MKIIFRLLLVITFTLVIRLTEGAEIKHVVMDLEDVLVQKDQEYAYNGKNLFPVLEEFKVSTPINEKQNIQVTYYLKPEARQFIEYLLFQNVKVSILSYITQSKLNSILSQIRVKDQTLFDFVEFAFGKEAILEFHAKFHDAKTRITKDQRIIFDENAPLWAKALKKNDLSILTEMKTLNTKLADGILFIDSQPSIYMSSQVDSIFHFQKIKKNKVYWNKLAFIGTEEKSGKLKNAYERQRFLGELESERAQFSTLMTIFEFAKNSHEANDIRLWEKLVYIPKLLALEKTHFKYWLADFAIRDLPEQDVLFLGSSVELFFESAQYVRDRLGMKGVFYYVSLNDGLDREGLWKNSFIQSIFSNTGIREEDVLEGKRKLRIVEQGFYKTLTGSIIKNLVGDRKTWQSHVLNFSVFRFSSFLNGSEPYQFKSLDEYLDFTAYVESPTHQYRVGVENLREILHYLMIVRPDSDHPQLNQNLVLQLMKANIRSYFENTDTIDWLKNRIAYLKKKPVFYPKIWNEQEPRQIELGYRERSKLNTALEVFTYQEELRRKYGFEKYWSVEKEEYPGHPVVQNILGENRIIHFGFDLVKKVPQEIQQKTQSTRAISSDSKPIQAGDIHIGH